MDISTNEDLNNDMMNVINDDLSDDEMIQINNNDTLNFYNYYKDNIQNIFNELYEIIGKPHLENDLIQSIFEILQKQKIIINKYDLECVLNTNDIYLNNPKEKLSLEMHFFCRITINKDDKSDEIWACNEEMIMLLADKDEFIYYLNEYENEEGSNISIVSDLSKMKNAILSDKTLFFSNKNLFNISDFKDEFNKNKSFNLMIYFTGINSFNFKTIKNPEKIQLLRNTIELKDKLKNDNAFQYYLYNKHIGLTLNTLMTIDRFIEDKCPYKYFYVNTKFILNETSKIKIKKYIAYYLTKLFDDFHSYEIFFNNLIQSLPNKELDRLRLIYKIMKFIIKNTNNNCYFIFDNIYLDKTLFDVNKICKKLNDKSNLGKNNFVFCFFVQLNTNTLKFLDDEIEEYNFKFINNDNSIRPH